MVHETRHQSSIPRLWGSTTGCWCSWTWHIQEIRGPSCCIHSRIDPLVQLPQISQVPASSFRDPVSLSAGHGVTLPDEHGFTEWTVRRELLRLGQTASDRRQSVLHARIEHPMSGQRDAWETYMADSLRCALGQGTRHGPVMFEAFPGRDNLREPSYIERILAVLGMKKARDGDSCGRPVKLSGPWSACQFLIYV